MDETYVAKEYEVTAPEIDAFIARADAEWSAGKNAVPARGSRASLTRSHSAEERPDRAAVPGGSAPAYARATGPPTARIVATLSATLSLGGFVSQPTLAPDEINAFAPPPRVIISAGLHRN